MIDAQDKMLQDALSTLAGAEAEAPVSSPVEARRTRIVEQVTAPTTGYRVAIAGKTWDVEATDHGDAVVRVLIDPATPGVMGGYVFMWEFSVTDSTGLALDGGDRLMRDLLQAARIRHRG